MQEITYSLSMLEKLHAILHIAGYSVRYEKGNFNTGFCMLDNNKTIVINKFSSLDAKINAMVEIIKNTTIDNELIVDDKLKKVLYTLHQTKLTL